jgi:hypothetical protein
VLKRRKLKRGYPEPWQGEKSPCSFWENVVLGNTLKSRQAHGRTGGSCSHAGRWFEEEDPKFLRKGKRGMTVKPISWVLK